MEEPSFQPIITLYDAVTDSPVFRSSVYRYDQQLEHLEHWLDSLSRHLKLYTEKLNKLNLETMIVCQKAIPEGIDETLIDPNFTGAVMKSFADALQTSLSFKAKLVSNLEECLISPLQQFVKTHLRDFKNFRKQHEKAMERYEAQLAKYSALNKAKEPSSIREEAFRLHEARKEYVRMSGQHVLRILNFRSLLEHCLIERFSAATMAHKDFYNDIQVWANLDAALSYWKQWLFDDKFTCSYQLHKQQIARKRLEDEYIRLTAPDHDIGKYIPASGVEKTDMNLANSKWGYLFVRISRHSWTRKWFFIHSGYFGSCQVDNANKHQSSITIENRVRLLDCEVHAAADTDRRFCFEITQPKLQTSYVLQAETEESMQDWIRIFTKNKGDNEIIARESGLARSPSLRIKSKSNPTTAISSPTTTTTTEIVNITSSNASSPKIKHNDSSSSFSSISSISVNNIPAISDSSLTLSRNISDQGPSIVMMSTTPDTEASLDNSSSLTPLLVWEAARNTSSSSTKKLPSASWGIPWSLVPTMVNLTQDTNNALDSPNGTTPTLPQVIWPAKPASVDIPKIEINGYTDKMNSQNRELRRLFGGVKSDEVVLDVFVCCLRKKPAKSNNVKETETSKSSLTSPSAGLYETELVHQLTQNGLNPPSEYGYAYTGRGFITQDTFWFYSCVLMSCINTVAIRLKDIDEIQVVKDTSLTSFVNDTALSMKSDMVISIRLVSNAKSDIKEPLIIGTLMDDIEMIAEKLRFAVNNAKNDEPMQIRNVYNKMQSLSSNLASHKSVVLDLPLTFNSAIKAVQTGNQSHTGNIVMNSTTKRPHAATVGQEAKVNSIGILKTSNRQRGESEPTRSTVVVEQPKKKPVVEAPKPIIDPDLPPSNIKAPDGPVECNCDDHLERQDAQINLPISAKRCYELLFSNEQTAPPTNGGVWEEKTAAIVGYDLSVTKWGMVDGKMQRVLKYWMPVSNPIVRMKEAEVVETQILIYKEDYVRYTVQISTKTAALPYADAFIPSVRYCITWISKSECQLTCYLGVRWIKSVLVRAIVTRAALKGMSDSVGVFIPILKAAAENVKESLDESRRKLVYNNSIQRSSLEDALSQKLNGNMESLVEEERDEETEAVHFASTEDNNEERLNVVPAAELPSLSLNHIDLSNIKITPSPSVSSTSTSKMDKNTDSVLQMPNQQQKPSTVTRSVQKARVNNDVKPLTTKQHTPTSSISNEKSENKSSWLSTINDYAPLTLTSIASIALFGFTVYMTILWFKSGTKVIEEANTYLRLNVTDSSRPAVKNVLGTKAYSKESISRSVYLRDLEEGFLRNSILPPYAGSESYKLFLESKNIDLTDVEEVGDISNRNWYSVDHYRLAVDLDISRERIATLRHDMLIIFQVLNKVDSQLVENEYMNWLLDTRLKCKYYPRLPEDDPRAEKSIVLCNDIKKQLDKLF